MIVRIEVANRTADPPAMRVVEPENLRRLHVELVGLDADAAIRHIEASGLGCHTPQAAEVWLDTDQLRRLANTRSSGEGANDADGWEASYDAMLATAADYGWIDESGRHVKAHVIAAD